jgi:cytoskeleton protein RodZ
MTSADIPESSVRPLEAVVEAVEMRLAVTGAPPDAALGQRLMAARQARGLSLGSCAQKLRLPTAVLQRIEQHGIGCGDSPIYLRSQLHGYARLLGVPAAEVDAALAQLAPRDPPLVMTGNASHLRLAFERYATAATYIVLTAVIAVPVVWLGLRGGLDRDLVHIEPLDATTLAQGQPVARQSAHAAVGTAAVGAPAAAAVISDRPLLASIAPFPALESGSRAEPAAVASAPPANGADHQLQISLSAPSWVEVTNADGQHLEYALLPAGTLRTYRSAQALQVRIGNADAATVTLDGKPYPLDDHRHANVASFSIDAPPGRA